MKEGMQKTTEDVGYSQIDRVESEVCEGVRTFMWIVGERLV